MPSFALTAIEGLLFSKAKNIPRFSLFPFCTKRAALLSGPFCFAMRELPQSSPPPMQKKAESPPRWATLTGFHFSVQPSGFLWQPLHKIQAADSHQHKDASHHSSRRAPGPASDLTHSFHQSLLPSKRLSALRCFLPRSSLLPVDKRCAISKTSCRTRAACSDLWRPPLRANLAAIHNVRYFFKKHLTKT